MAFMIISQLHFTFLLIQFTLSYIFSPARYQPTAQLMSQILQNFQGAILLIGYCYIRSGL